MNIEVYQCSFPNSEISHNSMFVGSGGERAWWGLHKVFLESIFCSDSVRYNDKVWHVIFQDKQIFIFMLNQVLFYCWQQIQFLILSRTNNKMFMLSRISCHSASSKFILLVLNGCTSEFPNLSILWTR